jgi:hypothetical protein
MRTTLKVTALAIAALALAGCGGTAATTGTSPPAATSAQSAASQSATAAAPTAAQVADQLGATSIVPVKPTLYAYDEADAVWDGRNVDIATFATEQLRDSWKTVASQFSAILLTGPLYVVADNGPAS